MKNLKIGNFIFNDGIKQQEVFEKYDNWLTSLEYDDYSKAYVVIDDEKINLFQSNAFQLKVGNDFKNKDLEEISNQYDLIIIDDNYGVRCVTKNHFFEDFYYLNYNNKYTVIYSLGGSRFIESIYIHGVWKI